MFVSLTNIEDWDAHYGTDYGLDIIFNIWQWHYSSIVERTETKKIPAVDLMPSAIWMAFLILVIVFSRFKIFRS